MFSTIYLRLEGNVPPWNIQSSIKHLCNLYTDFFAKIVQSYFGFF